MGTASTKNAILADVTATFGQVPTWLAAAPEASLEGFWGLMKDFYLAETKVPNKYKELIGIAVSGATRCKYCQLFHTEAAKLFGATDDEINEACMMGGVTMAASTFINALGVDYDVFARETREIVAFVKQQAAKQPPQPTRPGSSARA
jgi:AhpD family alkylhydroperoxidase